MAALQRPAVSDQTLLIKSGRIVYVGPPTDFRATRVIDASRRYALPGLIDTHVHSSGLAPMEALSSATSIAARCLNLSQSIGSIDVWKQADVLVLSGNPLEISEFLDRVDVIVKAGEVVWTAAPSLAE